MTTDSRIQELIDHHEIGKLLAHYCHGCDRGDEHHMRSVYAEESWDDHGIFSGNGTDFSRSIMDGLRHSKSLSHLQGQSIIRVDGDTAGAETYFFAVILADTEEGGEIINQLGGHYVDALVREDGRWKISSRVCVRDWSITLPVDADWIGTQGLKPGYRSGRDPSYAVLGIAHSEVPGFDAAHGG